jgi:hypothetical protein
MAETNVANTVMILGRTDVIVAWTHWKTIVFNDPVNRAAIKINSLFIVNRNTDANVDLDVRIARDPLFVPGAIYAGYNEYFNIMQQLTLPRSTTMIAISRDNPIWLQPGDFLQIRTSLNYSVEVVCSYEYISDTAAPVPSYLTIAGPVQNLNVAPTFGNGGVDLTWTPPLSNGGVAITNYLVEMREKVVVPNTSPVVEGWNGWYLVQKPVSDLPNFSAGAYIQYQSLTSTDLTTYTVNNGNSNFRGLQFRVAAYTPMGLGEWSEPSPLIRMDSVGTVGDIYANGVTTVGVIETVDISPIPNGVIINWGGQAPVIDEKPGETLLLLGYRVRWSDDNGMTWLPTPDGIRRDLDDVAFDGGETKFQLSGMLQNGTYYVFSFQAICRRTVGTGPSAVVDEIVGPWCPPTRAIQPPGEGGDALSISALRTMFVRWEYPA